MGKRWGVLPADGEEGLVHNPPPSVGRESDPAADRAGVTADFRQLEAAQRAGRLVFLLVAQGGQNQVQVRAERERKAPGQQELLTLGQGVGAWMVPRSPLALRPGLWCSSGRHLGGQGELEEGADADGQDWASLAGF